MNEKFKAEISFVDKKTNLLITKEMTMGGCCGANDTVYEMIAKDGHERVDVKVSMYDKEFDEWIEWSQKSHYNANDFNRDFKLICDGEHEETVPHSWCEATIINLKNKIIFTINDACVVYSKELLDNPEVIFYRFKYTDESGKVYRFSLLCNMTGCNESAEYLNEIKETVLKPGARWYCDHFREKYRSNRQEDAWSKWFKRRDEINKED